MVRRLCTTLPLLLLAVAGCGDDPGPGPTPVVDPPQIACPASLSITGITGGSQSVSYAAPTVTAGAPPVNASCAPASGSAFPLGTTTVNCMASDAQGRQAACSFTVSVRGLTLGATKFAAYGDSLTEGQNGIPPFFTFIDTPNAYPTKLLARLDETFPGQGIVVINRGQSGRRVEETRDMLPGLSQCRSS